MPTIDPYQVLDISRTADPEQIKKAYRKLALQYHPDRNPGDSVAEERFKEIGRAYEILSDPGQRERFDRFGTTDDQPGMSDFFGGGFGLDDALRAFMENFGIGGFGGFGGRRERAVRRGKDLTVEVELDLVEAALGGRREFDVKRDEPCPECNGSGADPEEGMMTCRECNGRGRIQTTRRTILGSFQTVSTCSVCDGTGSLPRKSCSSCKGRGIRRNKRTISVNLPAGIDGGHFLRLRGEGHHPGADGMPGDLIVRIRSVDYRDFTRKGDDLVYDLTLSFPSASLGTEVEIVLPDDTVRKVDIPSGIQPGDTIVISGEGMGRLKRRGRGNLVVAISVYVPTRLSKSEKSTLRELLDSKHFIPDGK